MLRKRLKGVEALETRRMLTLAADVVFIFDESGSSENTRDEHGFAEIFPWLEESLPDIDAALRDGGVSDVRYGLVGFGGNFNTGGPEALGHSFVVDQGSGPVNERLFSDGDPTEHVDELLAALDAMSLDGRDEDGWDAIEHTLTEYQFREGSVPVLVLLQSDEGRISENGTLTREGILSGLNAANAVLNVIVPGAASNTDIDDPTYFDLFSTSSIAANQRVVGVEADADGDGLHAAYTHIDGTNTTGTAAFDDRPGSSDVIEGEEIDTSPTGSPTTPFNNGADGETENAYVRLAWDTGGAVWDAGIIDSRSVNNGGELPDQANREGALTSLFAASLTDQVRDRFRNGTTFVSGEVVAAVNFGGGQLSGFSADPESNPRIAVQPASAPVQDNPLSNSIPSGIPEDVFRNVRIASQRGAVLDLSVDTALDGTGLVNGVYTLELLFNDPSDPSIGEVGFSNIDVSVEGSTEPLLENYEFARDRTLIQSQGSNPELSVQVNSTRRPLVKRYEVEVVGGNGLQIRIAPRDSGALPSLAGARLLQKPTAPALVGDYNRDFSVDAADYTYWRDRLGDTVTPFTGADGNGDGMITQGNRI